jgi:hypothetical protein
VRDIGDSKVPRRRQNRPFGLDRFEQCDLSGADEFAVGKIEANEKPSLLHLKCFSANNY